MNLRQLVKYVLWRDTTHHGEFRVMNRLAGEDCPRNFIDVGANDGFYGSNSFPYVARGWHSLLIEPHPFAFESLRARHARRPHATCLNCACGAAQGRLPLWTAGDKTTLATLDPDHHPHFTGKERQSHVVEIRRLGELLVEHKWQGQLGILSIDTEGWDLEVLKGLDLGKWRPRLIITEDSRRGDQQEKEAYLATHDYSCQHRIGANAFWVAARK